MGTTGRGLPGPHQARLRPGRFSNRWNAPWMPSRPRLLEPASSARGPATHLRRRTWPTAGPGARPSGRSRSVRTGWEGTSCRSLASCPSHGGESRIRVASSSTRTRGRVRSVGRLADIRQDLVAMRKLAWREGWLPRDVDPLDGLSLPRQQTTRGAGRGFAPSELRPERRQLAAMADCLTSSGPAEMQRLSLMGTQIRGAGHAGCGLVSSWACARWMFFLIAASSPSTGRGHSRGSATASPSEVR